MKVQKENCNTQKSRAWHYERAKRRSRISRDFFRKFADAQHKMLVANDAAEERFSVIVNQKWESFREIAKKAYDTQIEAAEARYESDLLRYELEMLSISKNSF